MDPEELTTELSKIRDILEETISDDGRFPWIGYNCRRVGDLLIGLQSKSGRELLSSNYKEHGVLCGPLGYSFREFPVAAIRSK